MNALNLITRAETESISATIGEIEQHTSAEIVCAIATESGSYDRAESVVGLLTAVVLACLVWAAYLIAAYEPGSWHGSVIPPAALIVAFVVGFVLGNYIAYWVPAIRRLFVSEKRMQDESERSACYVFQNSSVGETSQRCGLLIYVSIFEHKLIVLPDPACRSALGDSLIREVCDSAVARFAEHDFAGAFQDALEKLSGPLSEKLPANRKLNPNEIDDHLLIFHPSVV